MTDVTSASFLRLAQEAESDSPVALPPSFPQHVQYLLEREIVEGRLPAGARVTEEELVQRMGVSRTPVREAIRVLESAGLIVRRRGRGTFIAPLLTAGEARALFATRVPIEGYLTACAAERATDAEVARLRELVEEFEEVTRTQAPGDEQLVTIDSRIHWTIYSAARTDLVSMLMSYWGRLMRETHSRIYRTGTDVFAEQHRQILEAIAAHDPITAQALMDEHLWAGWDRLAEMYAESDTTKESSDPHAG
jgi:DNA-binding GntR family transcriptional regulator